MSLYHTFTEANNQKFTLLTKPDAFIYKENPFKNTPYIDSNIAGLRKKNIMMMPKPEPKVAEKPYPYSYQSCCSINVPVSPEYLQLREVIFSP
jgi:hypothetical protein